MIKMMIFFSSYIFFSFIFFYIDVYIELALLTGRDAFVSERLSILKTLTYTSDVFAGTNG